MSDVERTLSQIADIRSHLAAGTLFRGFGPAVIAGTGALALGTGLAQSLWPGVLASDPTRYVICWTVVAVVAAMLIGAEMLARSQRLHGGMADSMMLTVVEHFLPAGAAGAAIAAVIVVYAPDTVWLLPGLWQVLVALGIFASLRTLPGAMGLAAAWYFVTGVGVLILASADRELTPWMMAIPFAAGQLMIAVILRAASGGDDAHPA